jgi:hypothetical protein
MIVLQASKTAISAKPVVCPKCGHGKLGHIPAQSEAVISRRGKPPPDERGDCVQIKCPVCRSLWTLTIEN